MISRNLQRKRPRSPQRKPSQVSSQLQPAHGPPVRTTWESNRLRLRQDGWWYSLFQMQFPQMFVDKFLLPLIVGILIALFPLVLPSRKFKKLWVRWVAAALLFIAAGGAVYFLIPRPTEKTDLGITGRVVEESTQASISDASVSLSTLNLPPFP